MQNNMKYKLPCNSKKYAGHIYYLKKRYFDLAYMIKIMLINNEYNTSLKMIFTGRIIGEKLALLR